MSPLARATICKNMNESRPITKLIYRKEAVLYGKQFVENYDVNDVLAKTTDETMTNLRRKKPTAKQGVQPRAPFEGS
jgi:hypothetical protein